MLQHDNHGDAGLLKSENGRMLMTGGDGPEQDGARQTMPFAVHISR